MHVINDCQSEAQLGEDPAIVSDVLEEEITF